MLSTSAIEHIFEQGFNASDSCVAFFFVRFDNPLSLKAETILRSIIRQSMDVQNISKEMEIALRSLDQKLCPSLDDWLAVLRQRIEQSNRFYIFIDGVDECDNSERRDLLRVLSILSTHSLPLKVFLTSRESLPSEVEERFPDVECLSMANSAAESDINLFIEEELQARLSAKDLMVGDPSVVAKIQTVLTQHADGM